MVDRTDAYAKGQMAKSVLDVWAQEPLDFDSQLDARDEALDDAVRLRDSVREWGLSN